MGPKAAMLARRRPGGSHKWPQNGQNRLKTGLFPDTAKIHPKYAKKRLFCFWGAFVLVKRRRPHGAGHLWRPNVAVHRFARCFNTSTSCVQRKPKHGKRGKRPPGLAPQGRPHRAGPAGQLFSSSQTTQCSYKFSELSILVFTITQVNIYRHPIKLIQGRQPFSPPVLVFTPSARCVRLLPHTVTHPYSQACFGAIHI